MTPARPTSPITWHTASRCPDGQCVEVGWRKSTHSSDGGCVEVRRGDGTVYVRNSRDRSGPVLEFTQAEWAAFTAGMRAGEFDPPTTYRCIGKPTTTDDVGRVVAHLPACGWEGNRPEGASTFCPKCGGWLQRTEQVDVPEEADR